MSLKSEMAHAANEILSQVGEPGQWTSRNGGQSKTVSAIVSQAAENVNALDMGGFKTDYEFSLKVLQADFLGAKPSPLDTVSFDGETYAVKGVAKSRVGPYFILQIGLP